MPKIAKNGSTIKQTAYARRVFGGEGKDRKHIALDVGYSPSVANDIKAKLESTKGFNNAMAKLATESNAIALQVMYEFKSRGVKDFSNKDLVGALNAIGNAWSKFNSGLIADERERNKNKTDKNKLRTVILQQVERQTIQVENTPVSIDPLDDIRNLDL
jgi:hypothetical protein